MHAPYRATSVADPKPVSHPQGARKVVSPYFATALVVRLPNGESSLPLSLEHDGAVAIPNSGFVAELLSPSPLDRMQHRMLLLATSLRVHNQTDLPLLALPRGVRGRGCSRSGSRHSVGSKTGHGSLPSKPGGGPGPEKRGRGMSGAFLRAVHNRTRAIALGRRRRMVIDSEAASIQLVSRQHRILPYRVCVFS